MFDAKFKSKYITVNGKKVIGNVKTAQDGVIEVQIIHRHKEDALQSLGDRVSISQNIHFLSHHREIEIGYLTAAYLMWFYSFGYSWILQDTLAIVRQQLHNPSEYIIQEGFYFEIDGFHEPRIGVVELGNTLLPSVLLYDKIVYFPNAHGVNCYQKISELFSDHSVSGKFTSIGAYRSHKHPPFLGMVCKGHQLIIPQPFINQEMLLETILYYDAPDEEPYFMFLDNS